MFVSLPESSISINPYIDFITVATTTIISSASLGILISSIVKDANIAMSVAPLILVPQLLFSGMLFPLKELSEFISVFVLCRWSVSAIGTSLNLNELPNKVSIIGITRDAEDYFTYTIEHYNEMLLIMLAMSVIMIIASHFILKKQLDNKN